VKRGLLSILCSAAYRVMANYNRMRWTSIIPEAATDSSWESVNPFLSRLVYVYLILCCVRRRGLFIVSSQLVYRAIDDIRFNTAFTTIVSSKASIKIIIFWFDTTFPYRHPWGHRHGRCASKTRITLRESWHHLHCYRLFRVPLQLLQLIMLLLFSFLGGMTKVVIASSFFIRRCPMFNVEEIQRFIHIHICRSSRRW